MRLSPEKIRAILQEHKNGTPKTQIARQLSVDISTVRAHITRFDRGLSTGGVYSLVAPLKRACIHPSLKCLLCGKAQDHIHREEREEILHLKSKLERATAILDRLGYEVE